MTFFAKRSAQTTLPCPTCKQSLLIARTCHVVYMQCPHCNKQFPLKEFVSRADAAMETFLEQCYMDRI